MPLPSSRMTKQPARPVRYFPGKAYAEDPVSDDEESDAEDEEEEEEEEAQQPPKRAAPPKVTSFPGKALAVDVSKPSVPLPRAQEDTNHDLEGFVTASESSSEGEDEGSSDEEEDSSEEEESSSDGEPKRPMLAPKFISKADRARQAASNPLRSAEQDAEEEERKRKEKADELLQAQIERDAAARKAGKKYWDDEDAPVDEVDDRDDLDPEAEKAAWKLRELKRVQRDRQALIAKEQEREEIERRRNMTAEEREKEDREFLDKQAEDRKDKGKMAFMQKYFHKGAFFQPDEQDEEVKTALNRDIAGRKFVDEVSDKAVLPEYMRIRDMTRLGKKGRTKYKDLKSEDTGRWGQLESKKREYDGLDERFRPDERSGTTDRTGANAAPVGERRRRQDNDGREEKRPRYD